MMANVKPLKECTKTMVEMCEPEKLIVRKFIRDYEEKFGERISQSVAICEIILAYGELKNKK